MKIFKFGGASVKDAAAVRNVSAILKKLAGEKRVIVVSAIGKTTNALEEIHIARFHKRDYRPLLEKVKEFHLSIGRELFSGNEDAMEPTLVQFEALREHLLIPATSDFDMEYDQIVCYGELISTALVCAYLKHDGHSCAWVDARQVIRTDSRWRDARVDWVRSVAGAEKIREMLGKKDEVVIQGFIGSNLQNRSTTLGREGSDFTAAIMAFLLDAESVTIWKDVPGMLNADPRFFPDAVKLDSISFREAIELAYYGASVIHPKTIKPLQNKNIPLYIRSFVDPDAPGTVIQEKMDHDHLVPNFIFRENQVLFSITPKDFSFVVEDNLKEIFDTLSTLGIRINLMENSAISFSICIDQDLYKQEKLLSLLGTKYEVKYNEGLTLLTIRHYDDVTIARLTRRREVLLEHRSRQTVRMVLR